jgi:alpha/beta hydrolase fold
VEADATHGFSEPLRVAVLQWMRRWLLNVDEPAGEPEFKVHADHLLQCTPRGQVLLMEGAKSLNDLCREQADRFAEQRETWKRETSQEQRLAKIGELIGCRGWEQLSLPQARSVGKISRENYQIEKLILEPAEGIVLPALLFEPPNAGNNITLYLHGEGKHMDVAPGGKIEQLARQGQRVLAVDLRGYGETESPEWRFSKQYLGSNAAEYFISYMLGQSLVGSRAEDILCSAKYLSHRFPQAKLQLLGVGQAGIPVLHAAAIGSRHFQTVRIDQTLDTWNRVIDTPVTIDQLENTVHEAMKFYDLPDLIDLAGRDKISLSNPRDATGQLLR